MKLASMKLPKHVKEGETADPCCVDYTPPDYPYGTRLNLEEDQLVALGITAMPTTSDPISITAIGTVIAVSEEQRDGKITRRLEIQITDMAIAQPGERLADRMYPSKKKA